MCARSQAVQLKEAGAHHSDTVTSIKRQQRRKKPNEHHFTSFEHLHPTDNAFGGHATDWR